MEYVTLRNGVEMPILGYGVYQVTQDAAYLIRKTPGRSCAPALQ